MMIRSREQPATRRLPATHVQWSLWKPVLLSNSTASFAGSGAPVTVRVPLTPSSLPDPDHEPSACWVSLARWMKNSPFDVAAAALLVSARPAVIATVSLRMSPPSICAAGRYDCHGAPERRLSTVLDAGSHGPDPVA